MASIECAVYNSDRIAVSELAKSCLKSQFWKQRNIKKTSVTFDEGLQSVRYNDLQDLVEIGKIFRYYWCKIQI